MEELFLGYLEKHKGILYKIIKMYAHTKQDQQDLKQDIIVQLWRSYNKFRGESKFSTWMFRVAINTAIKSLEAERKKPNLYYPLSIPDTFTDDYDVEKENSHRNFMQILKSLKPLERSLLICYLKGLPHVETAKKLGLSEVNVRVRLIRIKTRVKTLYRQQGYKF
ncbi:RNA polymerase sigma factor [Sphingobacterium sp. PCS056]|uniref:RNA polymerase sigma factor n=1 Tax=Sphingobacterium sp. PCS056 TaxID=2931400 RepID=UPI00200F42DB|nr:RNA polymerase sigma factor [Sphingobacterium sp. PCS056]UPZ36540.1 RNA polymerase sigma factor [Sphingobacterium sp. PCS056]